MKLRKSIVMCAIAALAVVASGCASGGMFTAGNLTDVQLQKGNYKIVARGVSGEASAGYLLGASWSMGMVANTFALARVNGTGMLYKEALDNLWANYQSAHGPAEGKGLALINIHYDSDALNLIVYTSSKVMVRADVIEFTE
jgi:Family of unknown function (DUF6567)